MYEKDVTREKQGNREAGGYPGVKVLRDAWFLSRPRHCGPQRGSAPP